MAVQGAMDYIHMYVMDLLLGVEPWLNSSDICERIEQRLHHETLETPAEARCHECYLNHDVFDVIKRNIHSEAVDHYDAILRNNFTSDDFVGQFGHYAYGNVTIGADDVTGQLYMVYGLDGK